MKNYYAVSPADTPKLLEDVMAEIGAGTPTGRWLALLDSAFDDERRPLSWPTTTCPVYFQDKLAAFRSIAPVLIELTSDDQDVLRGQVLRLLRHCRGRPMLSFIRTEIDPEALRDSWQNVLEIETEDGQSFLLRFPDTRTIPAIASVLPSSAWHRLSRNVGRWLYVDRSGKLQSLPPSTAESTPEDDKKNSIRITDKALAELLESSQPDALADALNEHFPGLLPADDGALAHQHLTEVCQLAARNGIEPFPELTALAIAVFTSEGNLLADPQFAAWLARRDYPPGGLIDALSNHLELHAS